MLTKSDHKLVTQGPYRWVRHPLYTVSLLMLFSLGVVAANWFILAYCTVGLVVFRFLVIPAEEEQLCASFGDEYREY